MIQTVERSRSPGSKWTSPFGSTQCLDGAFVFQGCPDVFAQSDDLFFNPPQVRVRVVAACITLEEPMMLEGLTCFFKAIFKAPFSR